MKDWRISRVESQQKKKKEENSKSQAKPNQTDEESEERREKSQCTVHVVTRDSMNRVPIYKMLYIHVSTAIENREQDYGKLWSKKPCHWTI